MDNLEHLSSSEFTDTFRHADMRASFRHADGRCVMAWDFGGVWIEVTDTSDLTDEYAADHDGEIPPQRFCRKASADVAAATAALIIAGDIGDEPNATNTALYAIAEPFWAGVPTNLRPIP
jgi:hypothetical protein